MHCVQIAQVEPFIWEIFQIMLEINIMLNHMWTLWGGKKVSLSTWMDFLDTFFSHLLKKNGKKVIILRGHWVLIFYNWHYHSRGIEIDILSFLLWTRVRNTPFQMHPRESPLFYNHTTSLYIQRRSWKRSCSKPANQHLVTHERNPINKLLQPNCY